MSLGRICHISISRRNVKAPATRGLRFPITSEMFGSRFALLSVMRLPSNVLGLWTFRPFDVSHPGRFAVYTITSAVLLCVCVKTRRKKCAWIYMNFFSPNYCLVQSHGDFILDVTGIDLQCHLEVAVTQQGNFGIKSTVVQKL